MGKGGSNKARVILISGPTAVGKTRVALVLAHRLQGEIVSADSVQVYRGLDVGSAKTPHSERQGVPHHLIDIVDPTEEYTAGAFYDDARRVSKQLVADGRVPIVVGGTGLYLRWFLRGKPGTPKETREVSALVDADISPLESSGDWDAAVEVLRSAGDTVTPQCICRNDWYRLRRALAIIKVTGLPRSHFSQPPLSNWMQQEGDDEESDHEFLCYFLYSHRLHLYRVIDLRCEEMLLATTSALAAEVAFLRKHLGYSTKAFSPAPPPLPAPSGTGRSAGGKTSEEHFLDFLSSFQQASRNYAKRQISWFKGEPAFRWIDASQPLDKIVDFIEEEYRRGVGGAVDSGVVLPPQSISKAEHAQLNSYQAKNKIFTSPSACAPILAWVEATQGGYDLSKRRFQ